MITSMITIIWLYIILTYMKDSHKNKKKITRLKMKNIYFINGTYISLHNNIFYKIIIILVRHMEYDYRNILKKAILKNFKTKFSDS